MNKQLIFMIIVTVLIGCAPSEQQIREMVREELSVVMERRTITDAKTIGPYSPAQQVGNFLFVSGQIALNSETGKLENADIETETKQVLLNLMNVLKSAGYDSSDVVSTTVYLKDINDFAKMNAVYAKHFLEGNYPTRATVQVAALPRDARIEISAIAYKSKVK
jgi:2-iminobutanoate/2-iminopropanoate deaminase